jgi:serine phosphatase RsbU (regulator of sigma subunit)
LVAAKAGASRAPEVGGDRGRDRVSSAAASPSSGTAARGNDGEAWGVTGRSASAARSPLFPIPPSAIVVVVVGVCVAIVLAVGARALHDANERRLVRQRAREVGAVAAMSTTNIQTELATGAALADATTADRESFTRLMQPIVAAGRPFVSVSVWRAGDATPKPLFVVGGTPELTKLPAATVRTFLQNAARKPTMQLFNLLSEGERRLGYASVSPKGSYVVYGEGSFPQNSEARIASNSAFADLDYALFVGSSSNPDNLLASSVQNGRLHGHRASTSVAFGDSRLVVVISPRGELGGSVLAGLWWLLLVMTLVLTAAAAVLVSRVTARRLEAEDLAQENHRLYDAQRSVALTLQHSLLTEQFPELPGVEIRAQYVAGVDDIDIGGDWYDVIALGGRRMMIAVGDVSGRGLGAATTMASLRFAMRAYAAQGDDPTAVLSKLSGLLEVGRDGHFATALCAVVDVDSRAITLANAGHPQPLLCTPDGNSYLSAPVGPPIGVARDATYNVSTSSLPPRGTLLFYTDGLVERRGEQLDAGLERLARAVSDGDRSLETTLSGILDEVIPEGSADDTALLGVRWTS